MAKRTGENAVVAFESPDYAAAWQADCKVEGRSFPESIVPSLTKLLGDLRAARTADLGCGLGHSTRILLGQGAKLVVGIDVNETLLKKAQRELPAERVSLLQQDICRPLKARVCTSLDA